MVGREGNEGEGREGLKVGKGLGNKKKEGGKINREREEGKGGDGNERERKEKEEEKEVRESET